MLMHKRQFFRLLSGCMAAALTSTMTGCDVYYAYPPHPRYNYYYYPDVDVYYHIYTGYYFYIVDGAWIRSRTLPRHIFLRPAYRRQLFIEEPTPYARNREHRQRFRERVIEQERSRERGIDRAQPQPGAPVSPRRETPPPPTRPLQRGGTPGFGVPGEPSPDRRRREVEDQREREELQREFDWRRRRGG
jgi:hypothetical protein